MTHSAVAHGHLFIASSVSPFSSMPKREREQVTDNQQISAKAKPIRAMIAMKQQEQNAEQVTRMLPQPFFESNEKTTCEKIRMSAPRYRSDRRDGIQSG